jgi:hypothetical protein
MCSSNIRCPVLPALPGSTKDAVWRQVRQAFEQHGWLSRGACVSAAG